MYLNGHVRWGWMGNIVSDSISMGRGWDGKGWEGMGRDENGTGVEMKMEMGGEHDHIEFIVIHLMVFSSHHVPNMII